VPTSQPRTCRESPDGFALKSGAVIGGRYGDWLEARNLPERRDGVQANLKGLFSPGLGYRVLLLAVVGKLKLLELVVTQDKIIRMDTVAAVP
jgi:hypothetical protein